MSEHKPKTAAELKSEFERMKKQAQQDLRDLDTGRPQRTWPAWSNDGALLAEYYVAAPELAREYLKLREEVEAWREFHVAEVLLNDIDFNDPAHDAAIKRVVEAIKNLPPMNDGTLERMLNESREFVERERSQGVKLRALADGLADLLQEIRDDMAAVMPLALNDSTAKLDQVLSEYRAAMGVEGE